MLHHVGHLLFLDLDAAGGADHPSHAREKQAQVVLHLCGRAHRGSRGTRRILLLDGHGRRDAPDVVHIRSVHSLQELARVGGKTLHVASLALGVQRVESQARFARAGHTGDHDQAVAREIQIDVLQIVCPRPADLDAVKPQVPVNALVRLFL